ncbi:DNA methylase N-4/N-6 domain protein [Oleiphilus messinensis]|uniref:DNA methylase N-4/N-6 domain protein n=1 Tax=Oleiphilus messinensis TaxID=141451 RepID=A0A1Y0IB00_9GAMM|nr:site-specific DNA-methyltransferase [Oleiphilus messinensis]ARU57697.1 DNA methylase N-4/N-6 domain protein [Oleiphilus messinensis]
MPILQWLNKEEAVVKAKHCAYRLLEEIPELSYGDKDNQNLLIQGDNLEALKALIPFYAGKVKCVFIDPPYNTMSAFEHYDDNLEHSKWLTLMYPRLELLRELLHNNGSIWVAIDDNEAHYLKVLMDEIFGRNNFVASVIWEKADSPRNSAKQFSSDHDFIFVYSKNSEWVPRRLPRTEESNSIYTNPDDDPRGPWLPGDPYANKPYSKGLYTIEGPTGRVFSAPPGRFWRISEEKLRELDKDNRIWWGPTGNARPSIKKFLSEVSDLVPRTLWKKQDVGSNRTSKNEMRKLFPGQASFATPKPEALIERVLRIATEEGDYVLDSFLGSGTTIAAAHKMNRRYVGVEIGEHARTLCQPRLEQVINGEQGGISESSGWKQGGGFRFYKLGQAVFDEYGCLNSDIKFPTLAAHIWYLETKTPLNQCDSSAYLGSYKDIAYYLLYNGILGDRRPQGGNVLTSKVLESLPDIEEHNGKQIIVYGESTRLGESRLKQANITFKQIPYDVSAL